MIKLKTLPPLNFNKIFKILINEIRILSVKVNYAVPTVYYYMYKNCRTDREYEVNC